MSDEENPFLDREPARVPTLESFRARLIPAIFCWFIGGLGLLGAFMWSAIAIWAFVRFGWIEPSPDTPALNEIAPTFKNILSAFIFLSAGISGFVAAAAWMKKRWRRAVIATILMWMLMGAYTALNPPPSRKASRPTETNTSYASLADRAL